MHATSRHKIKLLIHWLILFSLPLLVVVLAWATLTEISKRRNQSQYGQSYNDSILAANYLYASNNEFGFTDMQRTRRKNDSIYRIAILGDSFVWGDGLPWKDVWPHQLDKRLRKTCNRVEVVTWGKKDWSTKDQYEFIMEKGREFEIDLLLIGFVQNDPYMGTTPILTLADIERINSIREKIPLIGNMLAKKYGSHKYGTWLDALYDPQNLSNYAVLIEKLNRLTSELNWNYMFVLTPSISRNEDKRFALIKDVFKRNNVKYLDLEPAASKTFGRMNRADLRCNQVNSHPGFLVNQLFAKIVYDSLREDSLIPNECF